jgi:catechol 2,3-dioxygenase-like lactoylglutathione lyase family enzyme
MPHVSANAADLRLAGVDHTARPTWKLRETVEFYRDVLGLPLIHTISARGWGPVTHPDFLHFFFDSGRGSSIAFFYYLNSDAPPALSVRKKMRPAPDDHVFDATHTAWLVDSADQLHAWRTRLLAQGIEVSTATPHEAIESIYFRDPNGYFLEITRKLRTLDSIDRVDASLTLDAAIQLEEEARTAGTRITTIDSIWNRKAQLLSKRAGAARRSRATLVIYVPVIPEFAAIVTAAKAMACCKVTDTIVGYQVIESAEPLEFVRKELGLKPAVWYGLFTGGLTGRIESFDRERVRVVPELQGMDTGI